MMREATERCYAVIRLKIKEIAESKNINRTRLSRLADTNYKTINILWNDPYHEVTTTTLDKIAKALGVPVTDLLEQVPDKEK
jgi:DNA-binding Xre family transcriptional regulator